MRRPGQHAPGQRRIEDHTMLPTRPLLLCALIAELLAPATGQAAIDLQPQTNFDRRIPIHTADDDMGLPYGIWGAGTNYKVSFHEGMTFVPCLGRDYPHNQPWAWHTSSVRVGNVELVGNDERPEARQDEYRYEYRYEGFTETYDVLVGGIEQTFVFDQIPAAGDLIITGSITSQLRTPDTTAAHRSLTFRDANGQAIINYGTAIAFDAVGRRVALTTTSTNGDITLRVPEAWLHDATLPVVVDPIISVHPFVSGIFLSAPIADIDIARESESPARNLMYTYTIHFSAVDSDIFTALVDDDFSGATGVYSDFTSNWSSSGGSCAFVGGADRWVLVLQRYFYNNSIKACRLRCHTRDANSTTLATGVIPLAAPAFVNHWRADVGGSASHAIGHQALVTFQREDNQATGGDLNNTATSEVHAVLLDVSSPIASFGTPFLVQGNLLIDCEYPSVNQVSEGGADFSWICALQTFSNWPTGDDWDIRGWRIGSDGVKASGSFLSDSGASGAYHSLHPIVEGQHGRYAVAFTTVSLGNSPGKTNLTTGRQARIERFDWNHNDAPPNTGTDYPTELTWSSGSRDLHVTGLAYDTVNQSHWVTGLHHDSFHQPVFVRTDFQGHTTESGHIVPSPHPVSMTPCVFNDDDETVQFVFDANHPLTSIAGAVLGYPSAALWSTSGTSCAPSGNISWSGGQQIGSQFSQPAFSNASATAVHLMAISTAPANLTLPIAAVGSGCELLIDPTQPNFVGILPVAIGSNVAWPLPLPGALPAMTLFFQDWILDSAQLTSSRQMRVPLVK